MNRPTIDERLQCILRIRAVQVREDKHPVRAKLTSDVESFLDRGGTITEIPRGLSGERNRKYGYWDIPSKPRNQFPTRGKKQ